MREKVKSTNLDPSLVVDIEIISHNYDEQTGDADYSCWKMAATVNDNWDEHKTLFPDKASYYAECSRIANNEVRRKRFSDSGETLRRWCEVQATYANFKEAIVFLRDLSFDHLARAKKLYKDGKVSVPVYALAKAVEMNYTAEEMQYHFDPPSVPTEYDRITGHLDFMLTREAWLFLKSRADVDACLAHAKGIRAIVDKNRT